MFCGKLTALRFACHRALARGIDLAIDLAIDLDRHLGFGGLAPSGKSHRQERVKMGTWR
jgi:hypothetical protein